ncbi:hypothetical protein ABGT18_04755 [Pseudomonas putida]|uniref:hypothetical protein n=1 Tax=Pseudomonas putida TaxID=303 RepID=UPI00345C8DBC
MTAAHAAQYRKPADWQQFQRLSVAIASARFGVDFKTYGRNGQWQGGIDAYAYTRDGRLIAVQSKSKDLGYGSVLTPGNVTKAVEKAHKFKFKIDTFIIMTSAGNNNKLHDRALEITQAQQGKGGFSVEVWGWQDIEDVIREHESIQRSFYPELLGRRTSTRQWIMRAAALCGLITLVGFSAYEYLDYRAKTELRFSDTGTGVKRFVQQGEQLRAAYMNCEKKMESNQYLSSFEFDHYCSKPVDKELQAMRSHLQDLALDIDQEVFEKMTAMLNILETYHAQGRRASSMTAAYEDVYRNNMLKLCDGPTDDLFGGGLMQLLKSSAVQQLEYYHALRNFMYPSLTAMKAQVIASAHIMRGQKAAPSVLTEANLLNGFLSQNQAYHLGEVEYPLTLLAMKAVSAPEAKIHDEAGVFASLEASREGEVLLGSAITVLYGHHQRAKQLVGCGAMRPELMQELEKREAEITKPMAVSVDVTPVEKDPG